jgi:hypothetical protein
MSQPDPRNPKELFRLWRGGDAAAGTAMGQRFADWYYAIATARLGEQLGREPVRESCTRFSQGVAQVTEVRNLVTWAHGLITEEIARAGLQDGRVADANDPSAFSNNESPKDLLRQVRAALPSEMALLEACYSGSAPNAAEVERLAAGFGGMPLGVLRARYAVKRWLRDNAGCPLEVAPDKPVLDRAPLPLYEAGRMASKREEVDFEHWMLTDLDLCRDIAEFAPFSTALRGGVGAAASVSTSGGSGLKGPVLVLVGLGAAVIGLIIVAAIAWFVFGA